MEEHHSILQRTLIALTRAYQLLLSPVLGPHCRFYPSCSEYTKNAIHTHGTGRGLLYGIKRLLRCHPWGTAGFDPVPTKGKKDYVNDRL